MQEHFLEMCRVQVYAVDTTFLFFFCAQEHKII